MNMLAGFGGEQGEESIERFGLSRLERLDMAVKKMEPGYRLPFPKIRKLPVGNLELRRTGRRRRRCCRSGRGDGCAHHLGKPLLRKRGVFRKIKPSGTAS